jgi:nitroimidazol reductase NimA-like FMN-containing flavoprotein (pyridoxamine 5'-phosphate oxidase superfamily)
MAGLTTDQVNELLKTPVIARLATVKPDGAPYVVPVWQYWDGEAMYIIPRERSRFVEYVKNEQRVAISCADDVDPDHPRLLIEGRAEIVEGPAPLKGKMLEIAREMVLRYSGEPGLEYLAATIEKLRYLLRVKPDKMTTWSTGWHPRYG